MKRPSTLQKEWMCSTAYYSPRIQGLGCAARCYLATEGRNNSLALKQLRAAEAVAEPASPHPTERQEG